MYRFDLDALRAVGITEPETVWAARPEALEQRALSVPPFQSIPPGDPVDWFVNGKRVIVFPQCPRCTSYALHRKDNVGLYECTAEFQEIKWKSFIESDDQRIALGATKYLTDRLYGKAPRSLNLNHGGGVEIGLAEAIEAARKRAELEG